MQSLIVALALMMTTSAVAAETTATRLDGTTVVGELQSWDGQALVVGTKDGPVRLSAPELLSLRFLPASAAVAATEKTQLQPAVELVDGTVLPIEDFGRQGRTATLSLRGTVPKDIKNLELSDKSVVAARLQPLQGAAAKQWEEIRSQKFPSDVLVLVKRGSQSLDYIEGTIGSVTTDRIEFKLEDEMRRVERDKVAGVIFYRQSRDSDAEPLCSIQGRDGLRASVASVTLHDGLLNMKTLVGTELGWPLDDVQVADFSAGKILFLSDAEPATEEITPLVGLPASATLAASYGRPRRDQSAFGGPLTLWFPGSDNSTAPGHTQSFGRGLALRSHTAMVFRVPRGFTRLMGVAGIEPATRDEGSVRLAITGDERPLLDTELKGDQSPQSLELDITGIKRLKIVVDYGENLDTGDWVNLCDVRLVK